MFAFSCVSDLSKANHLKVQESHLETGWDLHSPEQALPSLPGDVYDSCFRHRPGPRLFHLHPCLCLCPCPYSSGSHWPNGLWSHSEHRLLPYATAPPDAEHLSTGTRLYPADRRYLPASDLYRHFACRVLPPPPVRPPEGRTRLLFGVPAATSSFFLRHSPSL